MNTLEHLPSEEEIMSTEDIAPLKGLPSIASEQAMQNSNTGLPNQGAFRPTLSREERFAQYRENLRSRAPAQYVGQLYQPSNGEWSTYDESVETLDDLINIDAHRARQQSDVLKAFNAIWTGAVGSIATAVEDIALMFDPQTYIDMWNDVDRIEGNVFSNSAKEAKEALYNLAPIYENPNSTGAFDSFFRWSTLRSGVDSAIGFAIPGYGSH